MALSDAGAAVSGLTVARAFFGEWARPFLQRDFPALAGRAAAGVFRGSQVHGADDALSRDHDWGPAFDLILTDDDLAAHGPRLRAALAAAAPREWGGHRLGGGGAHGVRVWSVDGFFREYLGFTAPPPDPRGWLDGDRRQREQELYLIRHGHLFADPLGAFTARRAAFARYPDAVRLQRLKDELFAVWHYGQYNLIHRLARAPARQDPATLRVALGYVTEAAMRLWLLLEGDYSPYWKWLAFELRQRPGAAALDALLRRLARDEDIAAPAATVDAVCALLHDRLVRDGLGSQDPTGHPPSLWRDLEVLLRRLRDAGRAVWRS